MHVPHLILFPRGCTMPEVCVVCGDEARYRCPGCARRTCSLKCVKSHKLTYDCSGKRNRTRYLPLSEYTTATLLDDYHLLEDIGRVVSGVSRDSVLKKAAVDRTCSKMKKLHSLRSTAKTKGIDLHLAPAGLSIRSTNKAQVVYNKRDSYHEILWNVQWVFPECGVECTKKRVKESQSLQLLLDQFIHPINGDPVLRHKLKKYSQDGADVDVLLKAERTGTAHKLYHRLSLADTLLVNLRGKTIIEYPILYVVTRGNGLYPIIGEHYVTSHDPPLHSTDNATDNDKSATPLLSNEDNSVSQSLAACSTGLSLICDSY